jgi:hypothetical protein
MDEEEEKFFEGKRMEDLMQSEADNEESIDRVI